MDHKIFCKVSKPRRAIFIELLWKILSSIVSPFFTVFVMVAFLQSYLYILFQSYIQDLSIYLLFQVFPYFPLPILRILFHIFLQYFYFSISTNHLYCQITTLVVLYIFLSLYLLLSSKPSKSSFLIFLIIFFHILLLLYFIFVISSAPIPLMALCPSLARAWDRSNRYHLIHN